MKKLIATLLLTLCPYAYSADATCLAMNMYYEAHAEKAPQARKAVAFVTINRMNANPEKYNGSVCKVVYEKFQFSWTRDKNKKPIDLATWSEYYEKANYILANYDRLKDPTNGATHFHATWMPSFPPWASVMKRTRQIGQHIFYK